MSSGSQIGGIVGGVIGGIIGFPIGAVFKGIQYGYAIGSLVGGYVDPQRSYGPRLEDASQQTSTVGGVIPFGYGVFTCSGNIIWADRLIEHKKTERVGKGGGQKQTTYTYTRSYAIGVCEGPIHEYLWVKVNGKLVYASDPAGLGAAMGWNAQMIADLVASSNEWLQSTTLYMGTDTQMPDSTIVAVEGVGNVSPFRNLAYIVKENEDLTDMRGAVSQHEFCVRATPPEAYLTSKPYPVYGQDGIGVEHNFEVGALNRQMHQIDGATEQVGVGMTFGTAALRTPTVSVVMPPEEIQPGMTFGTAILRSPVVSVVMPPEEIQPGMTFGTAILREALITQEQPAEEIQTTFTFGEASLYVP
ncbi:MAG TPA: hypothetical protein VIK69_05410 [Methylophilaceae bacterium]